MATHSAIEPIPPGCRVPSRGIGNAAVRLLSIVMTVALAVACSEVHDAEKEPADFFAVNGCDVPIHAVGGPHPTYFSGGIYSPSIAPKEINTWKVWFDLADVGSSGAFYIWVEPATAKQWGSPIEVEFSDLRQIESESTVPQFTYEVSGALCPSQ